FYDERTEPQSEELIVELNDWVVREDRSYLDETEIERAPQADAPVEQPVGSSLGVNTTPVSILQKSESAKDTQSAVGDLTGPQPTGLRTPEATPEPDVHLGGGGAAQTPLSPDMTIQGGETPLEVEDNAAN
ncbi:hypothetical protein H9Q70_014608, partial [Fusarium xylarioides]